jgi:hypothetical protein
MKNADNKIAFTQTIEVTVVDGGHRILNKTFTKGPVIFGRGATCEVALDFSFVSRNHCAIIQHGNDFYLMDLESRNGISVSGEKVSKYPFNRSFSFFLEQLQIDVEVSLPLEAGIKREARPRSNINLLHDSLTAPHPEARPSKAKWVEAAVLWHDQIYSISEFLPAENITVGASRVASVYVPHLKIGWKLTTVDFETSSCYIPKGQNFSVRRVNGEVFDIDKLLNARQAIPTRSGFRITIGIQDVLKIDLEKELAIYLRYIPANLQLPRRKPVEPDFAIKLALGWSALFHFVFLIVVLATTPKPQPIPEIKNVPERFARLILEPLPTQTPLVINPTPTPVVIVPTPIPETEIAKTTPTPIATPPPKPVVLEEKIPPKPVKKLVLPKQLAKKNKWPIVVKKPDPKTAAAPINKPIIAPEPKVIVETKKIIPSENPVEVQANPTPIVVKTPPPVKVTSLGALAALSGLDGSGDNNIVPTTQEIKIDKNIGATNQGKVVATSKFGQGIPVSSANLGGTGPGSGSVKTKGAGSVGGNSYGTQGMSAKTGSRGIEGAVVGQPKLMSNGGKLDGLTREEVMKRFATLTPEVQHCFERSLLSNPDLQGRMEFEWDIEPDGHVSAVRIKKSTVNGGDALGECVKGAIMNLDFPKAKNGQSTTPRIGFPFGKI